MLLSAIPTQIDLQARLRVAITVAQQAGAYQRERLGQVVAVDTKSSPVDLVTEVDHACDAMIRQALSQAFPDDKLLTEETYHAMPDSLDGTWVVDPLDGTTNFAHGIPHFAVNIAYCFQNQPVVAVTFDPCRQELFSAILGGGAFLNHQPLTVSTTRQLSKALLATGFPSDRQIRPDDNMALFRDFLKQSRGVRRMGSAALDLAYVAAGRLDGLWEFRLAPWDVAAGVLLIQEAGGLVRNLCSAAQEDALAITTRQIHIWAYNHQPDLGASMQAVFQLADFSPFNTLE
ncbi:MAG: inositol monophosphatase family protein [Vampirovibrionales bacterium]|nr:inositol monophosphatase family protein [Vampirovibrionales bacterium]